MEDAKELLEKIDRALMHAQDLLADSLDHHGERDHVKIQEDILAAICAHAALETRGLRDRCDRGGGGVTRPILYIAGPYSAGNGRTVADNIAVARRYAVAAANAGWMPFTPHLNTAGFEVDCPGVSHEEWLAGDLAILKHLEPGYDAMLLLPNWEQSEGATLEVGWAKHIGLTILGPFDIAEEIPAPRRWIL